MATKIGELYGDVGLNTKPLDSAARRAKATINELASSAAKLRNITIGFKTPSKSAATKDIRTALAGMKPIKVPVVFGMPPKAQYRAQVAAYFAKPIPVRTMFLPPVRADIIARLTTLRPIPLPTKYQLPRRSDLNAQVRLATAKMRPMRVPITFRIPNRAALRAQLAVAFAKLGPISVPLMINARPAQAGLQSMQRATRPATKALNALQLGTAGLIGGLRGIGKQSAGLSFYSMIRGATSAEAALGGLGGALASLSIALVVAGTVYGLARAFRSVTDAGAQFQLQMSRNRGVLEATEEELAVATAGLRNFAQDSIFGANEAARGFYELASAGFDAKDSMLALPEVFNLSVSGFIEMSTAAEIAVSALAGFGYEAKELSRVNDALVITSNKTLAKVDDMAQAFKFVVPFARTLGYNIEEVSGFLGIMSDAGAKGTLAGRHLAQAMRKAAQIAAEFGLESSDLVDVLIELDKRGATANDIIRLFAQRGALAALILRSNLKQVRQLQLEIATTGTGIAKRNADLMLEVVTNRAKKLQAVFEEIKIAVFETFKDDLADVIQFTTDWIRKNKDAIVGFFSAILRFVTAVMGTLSTVAATITEVIAAFSFGAKTAKDITKTIDDLPHRTTDKTIIPGEAAGYGELLELSESGDEDAVNNFIEGMEKRATASEKSATKINQNFAHVREMMSAGAGVVNEAWDDMYADLEHKNGMFWGDQMAESVAYRNVLIESAISARAAMATPPDAAGWSAFFYYTGLIGQNLLETLGRLATTIGAVIMAVATTVWRGLEQMYDAAQVLAGLVTGNWEHAAKSAEDWWGRLKTLFTSDSGKLGQSLIDTWLGGWDVKGYTAAWRESMAEWEKEQIRLAEERAKNDEEAARRLKDTMTSFKKQFGGYGLDKDDKGSGKSLRDLAADAKRLADIYEHLAMSGTLSAADLSKAWEGYREARMVQLRAELDGIDKLSKDVDLMQKHVALATDEMDADIARLQGFGDPKALKAQVDLYKDLAMSASGTVTDISVAWDAYYEKRSKEIELERLEEIASTHDKVTANARAQQQLLMLSRERVDAVRGHADEIRSLWADHNKSILDHAYSNSRQVAAAWAAYFMIRKEQILVEAELMRVQFGLASAQVMALIDEMTRKLNEDKPEQLMGGKELFKKWAKEVADESSKVFSTFFFDVLKGETKKTLDYLEDIWDSFMKKLSDRMADMLVQGLVDIFAGQLPGGYTSLGSGGGGGGFDLPIEGPSTKGGVEFGTHDQFIPLDKLRDQRFLESINSGGGGGVRVDMKVVTDDVRSFRGSEQQIISRLSVAMRQAQLQRGN